MFFSFSWAADPSRGAGPVNGFELKDKRAGARVKPLSGSAPLTIRGSDPFGFEKLPANGGKVLPEFAGIRQRAVEVPQDRIAGPSSVVWLFRSGPTGLTLAGASRGCNVRSSLRLNST
jgi:hypothetical protein